MTAAALAILQSISASSEVEIDTVEPTTSSSVSSMVMTGGGGGALSTLRQDVGLPEGDP